MRWWESRVERRNGRQSCLWRSACAPAVSAANLASGSCKMPKSLLLRAQRRSQLTRALTAHAMIVPMQTEMTAEIATSCMWAWVDRLDAVCSNRACRRPRERVAGMVDLGLAARQVQGRERRIHSCRECRHSARQDRRSCLRRTRWRQPCRGPVVARHRCQTTNACKCTGRPDESNQRLFAPTRAVAQATIYPRAYCRLRRCARGWGAGES